MKLLGVADRFFYGSFILSISRTECSIKIMVTTLHYMGFAWLFYLYSYYVHIFGFCLFVCFFLKDKAILCSLEIALKVSALSNWPGTA